MNSYDKVAYLGLDNLKIIYKGINGNIFILFN